jgi:uncharacterized RDD family membrane protein YckC
VKAGGFFRRCLALPIDEAIVGVAWLLGALWLLIVYELTAREPVALVTLALLVGASFWLGILLSGVYFIGFVGACGQTPAKMLLGMRVVRRDGARVGYGRALLRWVGYGLVFGTLGLGWIVAALNAERRGLHDWIAGTRVIRLEA